jgi:hypothetical protein
MGDYGRVHTLFAAAALTANADVPVGMSKDAGSLLLQVVTTGFSGTLNFVGGISDALGQGVEYTAIPYILVVDDQLVLDSAEISETTDTGEYFYILPIVPEHVRVIMTRSAGSITIRAISRPPVNLPYTVNVA